MKRFAPLIALCLVSSLPLAAAGPQGTASDDLRVDEVIGTLDLSSSEQALVRALGSDAASLRIKRLMLASSHARELSLLEAYRNQQLLALRQDPESAFAAITRAVDRLRGPEFTSERAALGRLAAALPGMERETAALEAAGD